MNPQYTKGRRLTPNSRYIHQHWIPVSPGLGCAGLLYLDWQRLQQPNPAPLEDGDEEDDDDHGGGSDCEDADEEDEDHIISNHGQEEHARAAVLGQPSPATVSVACPIQEHEEGAE
jgi:hypothetical protein